MIDKIQTVTNGKICVSFSLTTQHVAVIDSKTMQQRIFGGWHELKSMYAAFENSMSDETTFKDAVIFFTPNINQTFISK
jgi:hypothetical protein